MIRKNDVVTVADRSGEATGKPRPAIIVTADVFATLDWIVICPLTTQPPEPDVILMREIVRSDHLSADDASPEPDAILMREVVRSDRLPLRERSWAEPHKITAIRRRRIGRRIGVLSDAEALWLNRVIVQLLGVA